MGEFQYMQLFPFCSNTQFQISQAMHGTRAFHVSDNVYINFGKLPRIKQIIILTL